MDSRRSHVMNDDVLRKLLDELNVKQLLRLESVSNQFMDCIASLDAVEGSALRKKNALAIGSLDFDFQKDFNTFIDGDITEAIVCKDYKYDVIESKETLDSILGKCFNIKCLYLNCASIDGQIITLITSRCPQLKSLHLKHTFVNTSVTEEEVTNAWTLLLSPLSHLTLEGEIDYNIPQLLSQLASLKSIELNGLEHNNAVIDEIIEYFPRSIRCLKLIFMSIDWDQVLPKICTYFKLNRLDIKLCGSLPPEVFTENIPKLNELRYLYINSTLNLITNVVQPMASLKCLHLNYHVFSPKMLHKVTQIYPNVKHLRLELLYIKCECNDHNVDTDDGDHQVLDCQQCIYDSMHWLSQLPQLKRLCFNFLSNDWCIGSNDMKLFTQLDLLSLNCFSCPEIEIFIDFVLHCIENRVPKKLFTFNLDPYIVDSLIDRLNDMKVTIPKNFIIAGEFM